MLLFLSGLCAGASLVCLMFAWIGKRGTTPRAKGSPTLADLKPKCFNSGAGQVFEGTQAPTDLGSAIPVSEAVVSRLEIPEEHALELLELYDNFRVNRESRAWKYKFWTRAHELVPELHKWPQARLRMSDFKPFFEVERPNEDD